MPLREKKSKFLRREREEREREREKGGKKKRKKKERKDKKETQKKKHKKKKKTSQSFNKLSIFLLNKILKIPKNIKRRTRNIVQWTKSQTH